MKIILSPSKTQNPNKSGYLTDQPLLFPTKHKKVLAQLRKLTKKDLQEKMKLSKELLEVTYSNIKNYNDLEPCHAFESFTGFVFMGLQKETYNQQEYDYISKHVRILDAFYGVLEPGTLMKPYRLDFTVVLGINLYQHWDVEAYFSDDLIINLASNEYAKMLPTMPMITIHFRQEKDGTYLNQATYSKQARGNLLNVIIQQKITNPNDLKSLQFEGYSYHETLSDENNYVFSRRKP